MPLPQPTEYRAAERKQQLQSIYLYIVRYGLNTWYFAYNDKPVTVAGLPAYLGSDPTTFLPGNMKHKQPDKSVEVNKNTMSMQVALNNGEMGDQFRELLLYTSPETVEIIIMRAQRKAGTLQYGQDCFIQYTTVVLDFSFEGEAVTLQLVSKLLMADGRIARVEYQKTCQKTLGGQTANGCKVVMDVDAFRLNTDLDGVTRAGKHVSISDTMLNGNAITAETFQGGQLWVYNDSAELVAKIAIIATEILPSSTGVRLYLQWWHPSLVLEADVKVFRGCKRTKAACESFNNYENFGGMPFIPNVSPSVNGIV